MSRQFSYIFYAILIIFIFAGCAHEGKSLQYPSFKVDMVLPPVGTNGLSPAEVDKYLQEVERRNSGVEDSVEWISRAYEGLLVRRLTNVSEREYHKFEKFLDNGAAYIIVHPGFFTFFHYPRRLRRDGGDYSEYNVLDLLLKRRPKDAKFALLQAQERRMRDFIEFKSTQKKLLIIITPKNYKNYSGYTYRKSSDEYMRYLNEITNLSDSVLFVESRDPNRGYISDDDALRLVEFLLSIKAKKIYVGGSYVGRCLEDFYTLLTREYGSQDIYIVPELSDISPRELSGALASELLKPDGSIDEAVALKNIRDDVYDIQESIPSMINLP